jgi:hypothetical protein
MRQATKRIGLAVLVVLALGVPADAKADFVYVNQVQGNMLLTPFSTIFGGSSGPIGASIYILEVDTSISSVNGEFKQWSYLPGADVYPGFTVTDALRKLTARVTHSPRAGLIISVSCRLMGTVWLRCNTRPSQDSCPTRTHLLWSCPAGSG